FVQPVTLPAQQYPLMMIKSQQPRPLLTCIKALAVPFRNIAQTNIKILNNILSVIFNGAYYAHNFICSVSFGVSHCRTFSSFPPSWRYYRACWSGDCSDP